MREKEEWGRRTNGCNDVVRAADVKVERVEPGRARIRERGSARGGRYEKLFLIRPRERRATLGNTRAKEVPFEGKTRPERPRFRDSESQKERL